MKPIFLITYVLVSLSYAQNPAYDPENPSGKLFEYAEYVQIDEDKSFSIDDILIN